MPPSKVKPESTYQLFFTDEPVSHVAKRLGVLKSTLRKWWVLEFGLPAYQLRVERKIGPEEKKRRRAVYRERNRDKIRQQKKEWFEKNRDSVDESKKRYRSENREKVRTAWNAYYAANGEQVKAQARKRRASDLEGYREKDRVYARLNPEKVMFKSAKGRAKRLGLPFNITVEDIRAVVPPDLCCPITGKPFVRSEGRSGGGLQSMSLDRVVPELGYTKGNVAVISHMANTLKNNCTDPMVFRNLANYLDRSL